MIGADESGNTAGEIALPLTVLEGTKAQRNAVVIRERQDISLRRAAINLSGSQLLVGFTSALCLAGLLLWALLKLWLFEP
jgi:hypothetical protein